MRPPSPATWTYISSSSGGVCGRELRVAVPACVSFREICAADQNGQRSSLKKIDAGPDRPSGKSAYPGTSPTFVHPHAMYSRSASPPAMVSKVSRVLPRWRASSSTAPNRVRPTPRRRARRCTSIFASSARWGWLGGTSSTSCAVPSTSPAAKSTRRPARTSAAIARQYSVASSREKSSMKLTEAPPAMQSRSTSASCPARASVSSAEKARIMQFPSDMVPLRQPRRSNVKLPAGGATPRRSRSRCRKVCKRSALDVETSDRSRGARSTRRPPAARVLPGARMRAPIKPAAWLLVVLSFHSGAANAIAPPAGAHGESTEVVGDSARTETLAAGPRYQAGWFTRFLLGGQWREIWTTPIEVPVLNLESFDGGLIPERRGGGQQTKSLRLKSGNGRIWGFRSVDKDATGNLDPETRESAIGDIVQDLTSTLHPGGALVVAPLLEAAGVLHATPQVAVMPDDPRLGEFRSTFAGMLGLLEERMERGVPGGGKVADTIDLLVRLDERAGEEVDARDYLRARLIDMLVGDWDRHLDQWRWIRFEEGGKQSWRAVPRDRDQAFSRFGGVFPFLIEYYTKQLTSFHASYPAIDKLTFSGRFTDRRFLVWLDAAAWEGVTADVVARLTDEVISNAVHRLPTAMYEKGGPKLERLLRARRDGLAQASRDFYLLLAARVDLRGSESETLALKRMARGDLEVASPRFRRIFHPGETDELRLYTPRGGQVREEGSADSSIGVRVVLADPRPPEPDRPRYEPFRDWGQDLLFFPQFSYDSNRGVVLGARALLTRFGFGLDPFSSQMNFGAAYATGVNRPRLEYAAQLRTRSPMTGLLYLAYSRSEEHTSEL